MHDYRLFCRDQDSIRTNLSSCTNGTIWNFSTLEQNNINTDDLLNWKIPFDLVERYADYLNTGLTNSFICNCTSNRIGSSCQYMLFCDLRTISEVLKKQLLNPKERESERAACLIDGIKCNAGLLCLEWRQVCDGIPHCDNGIDEAECYLLEFQQCASDEFQCRNSMCIPVEFLFDGTVDCMDRSDEQEIGRIRELVATCPTKSTFECDERLCRKDEFSCGDGQCIPWSNLIHHQDSCKNGRDAAYHCETIKNFATMPSGVCRYNGFGK
ncbi:unnamed protein product [Rotaria sp. Silwood2]|nr:unnamed protein product [Rotaria sp. Silwood2]CAF2947376.1 unnamed protein product [Rotaria sp. Silwood2]CAF3161174.1 unnamed protein product [Rotaria sp. Silwood2]CAF3292881.1 unnamed protein product [Rotaria sp. Silwood2]CAF3960804.1 unnamed protein product [Rotaria sp. Silwood2]